MAAKNTDIIAVRISPADRELILNLGSKYDLTISQIVRRALILYMKHVRETRQLEVAKEDFTIE